MTTPVPQRAVLVLPSTAEFDSRTYRIASSLAARGHEVTVLARSRAGMPHREQHPAGYSIVRVDAAAIDGLPFPDVVRAGRDFLRRLDARRGRAPRPRPGEVPPTTGSGTARPGARPSLPRRVGAGILRRLAIQLTVRSQLIAARRASPPADLFHGMAYMGVPIALDLARRYRAAVVYDARDIYVDAANLARLPRPVRWLVSRAERSWARRADRVITVNRPYAEVMASRWDLPLPLIVMNCSYRTEPVKPVRKLFHEALGLPASVRIVLYQGGFSPDRGIEQLIAAIPMVPGAVLVLLGYGAMQPELRRIEADPATGGRVRVMAAVPPADLLAWVAAADVVAMPIQPTTLNHRLTTPNKLFEAMTAGVPVVASDLPGMAPIVRETDCGRLVDPGNVGAIADALASVLATPPAEMLAWRERCSAHARRRYNWESQMELLLAEYGRLTGRPW